MKGKLLWQLFPTYLLIALVALLGLAVYVNYSMRAFYLKDAERQLESKAALIEDEALPLLRNADELAAEGFCTALGKSAGVRITLILADGRVIGDTDNQPAQMDNHLERPEIQDALSGGTGMSTRYSSTERMEFMYYAVRLPSQGTTAGYLRISMPLDTVRMATKDLQHKVLLAALIALILAAAASLYVSHRISARMAQMKNGAKRFAAGELGFRLPVSPVEEFGGLAEALNAMAEQLYALLAQTTRQRNELDAVLESMGEGVLAVSADFQILFINKAAAAILASSTELAPGKDVSDVVRNPELLRLVQRALEGYQNESAEVTARSLDGMESVFTCVASRLTGLDGITAGAIVVMRDVTRERKLEMVRRQFVANVSHELRTPITAIKGFAESLLDDSACGGEKADDLRVIVRHADRLNSVIEGLLALSGIEVQEGEVRTSLIDSLLRPILDGAASALTESADEKKITLAVECEDGLHAPVNAPLMEQALMNLISNAIKYSGEGGSVRISAAQEGNDVLISVSDDGCGIAPEHQERIFERFYRVDKGRDRRLGGAGLGLAIVRHIVLAHGGSVGVQSELGKGATFTIRIPLAEASQS